MSEVNLISNNWKLIFVCKGNDFFHMIFWKDCSHWICWIDNKNELGILIDQTLSIYQINLKVFIFSEFVRYGLNSKCRAYFCEKRITHLWNKDFISRIDKGHQNIEKSHIDTMIKEYFWWININFWFVKFKDCLSCFYDATW